ncbi:MAG: hypothetical protein JW973_01400 [Bacteroidales bacterium]|nr:hypothetical protein [Bacteroidales bacterium]
MKFAERIKDKLGVRILERKLKNQQRIVSVCSLKYAQNIGIIYNATEFVSFEIIKDFAKKLTQHTPHISILGYVNSKKLIDHYLYRKGFDFFSRNDLNWYYRPVSAVTDAFIKKPFDILINLSLEPYYPIQYIVALSLASFKVGKYSPGEKYLDLMIDMDKENEQMKKLHEEIIKDHKDQSTPDEIEKEIEKKTQTELQLSFLINQIVHYLSILKKN